MNEMRASTNGGFDCTRLGYERIIKYYITPNLGSLTLSDIKGRTVERWMSGLLDRGLPCHRKTGSLSAPTCSPVRSA